MAEKKFHYQQADSKKQRPAQADASAEIKENKKDARPVREDATKDDGAGAPKEGRRSGRSRRPRRRKPAEAKETARVTAAYPAEKMSVPLVELGLSEATYGLLAKNNVRTAGDLAMRTDRDMYKIQGVNKKMVFEVKDALKRCGMDFKETVKEQSKTQDRAKAKEPQRSQRGKDSVRKDRREQQKGRAQDVKERPEKLTEPLPVEEWRKVQKSGKWGFYDGFKTVIPAMYDEVFKFKEGLASVELEEKCGYIDSENNIVIPLEYDTAMSFSEGYACVEKGGRCGYINKNNEVVIPLEYDAATPFEGGESKVKKDGRWGTLTIDGNIKWI